MPVHPSVKLNTGADLPTLGLGTWKSNPGEVEHAVEFALRNGYKHIDTATAYENEDQVGQGILASGVPRDSFFLTTKLNNNDHARVEEGLEFSLKQLKTNYLDLWLMHWPAPMVQDLSEPDRSLDWLDTWKKMEEVYKANPDKVRAIGVSNFSIEFLERLLPTVTVMPAVNQIELHPACPQIELVEYCRQRGIAVIAYSPQGSNDSPLPDNPIVKKVAEKYKVTPSTILISLQANKPGVAVIPKSVTKGRIAANKTLIDLAQEDIDTLQSIDNTDHFRVCHPNWTGWGDLGFPDCK